MPGYSHAPIRAINKCATPTAMLERLPSRAADAGGGRDRAVYVDTHVVPCVNGLGTVCVIRCYQIAGRGQNKISCFGGGGVASFFWGVREITPPSAALRPTFPPPTARFRTRRPAAPWDCVAATRPSRPSGASVPARAANRSGHGFEIFAAVRVRMHITFATRSPLRAGRGATRSLLFSPSYPRVSASSAVHVVVNLCNPRAAVNSAAGSARADNKRNCKKVAPDFHHGAVLTHTPRPYICAICG